MPSQETLRKYSVVPVVTRMCAEDTTLHGVPIPAGCYIACMLQVCTSARALPLAQGSQVCLSPACAGVPISAAPHSLLHAIAQLQALLWHFLIKFTSFHPPQLGYTNAQGQFEADHVS